MSKARKPAVERYHDRVAHRYDDIYDDVYWQWHDILTWDYLKPYLPRSLSERIIDLGCGTGKWGLKIAHSGYPVTCVDISRKMIDVVERKVCERNLDKKVVTLQADLEDLSELNEHGFALSTALGEPLCSVHSPAKALKQIHRILKPQGVLVGTVDNRLNATEYYLQTQDIRGLEALLKTGHTHWLTKDHSERFPLHTYLPRQLTRLLEAAHFEVLSLRGKTILPLRHYRDMLIDKHTFHKLLSLEKKLSGDQDAIARAAHVQFAARKNV